MSEVLLGLLFGCILLLAVLQWRTQRTFLVVVTKQAKVINQQSQAARVAAEAALVRVENVREDTQLMQRRVETHMTDPRLKRLMGHHHHE